mmetsp:Transcript_22678/g.57408  ORF Transcript_22678/g.57408 Transcript_22678/m.57408 type:complete len:269 (-) Transcript_22678:206-1012(-)
MHKRAGARAGGMGAEGMCWSPTKRKAHVDSEELLLDRLQRGVKRMRLCERVGWGCEGDGKEDGLGDAGGMLYAQTKGAERAASAPFHDRSSEAAGSIFIVGGTGAKQAPTMLLYRTPHAPAVPPMGALGFAFEGTVHPSEDHSFLLEGALNPSALATVGFGDWSWTSGSKAGTGSVRRTFACRLKGNRKSGRKAEAASSGAPAFAFTSLDRKYKAFEAFLSTVGDDGSLFVFGAEDGVWGGSLVGESAAGSERETDWCCGDRFMQVVD